MRNLIILFFCVIPINLFSQNVRCEITDYLKKIDDKEYSTYEYVKASYSHSRPLLIIITNKKSFMKIHQEIPQWFDVKQEVTDIRLLGIKDFDKNHISETDRKIIDVFIKSIMKYREDNNLPLYTEEEIRSKLNYIEEEQDLCKLLFCRKLKKRS